MISDGFYSLSCHFVQIILCRHMIRYEFWRHSRRGFKIDLFGTNKSMYVCIAKIWTKMEFKSTVNISLPNDFKLWSIWLTRRVSRACPQFSESVFIVLLSWNDAYKLYRLVHKNSTPKNFGLKWWTPYTFKKPR